MANKWNFEVKHSITLTNMLTVSKEGEVITLCCTGPDSENLETWFEDLKPGHSAYDFFNQLFEQERDDQ